MSGEWVEQNVDVVDVEITSFLRGLRRRGYSFEKETDESGIVGYIVSHQGTEIGEIEIALNQLRGRGIRYTERIAIEDPHPHAFRNLLERLESRLDVRLVWAPRAVAEIHTELQADSGAVAEQLTPAEDEEDKKPGPIDRFASKMGQISGDKTEQVFISHATEDARFAHRLADDFQRLGVQVWIAPESILPGGGWVEAIERGLAESSHMVVVLTPAALESEWVRKETDVAIAQERKGLIQVIPLDVEPCEVPLLLGSYQMVPFHCNYCAGLSQLVDILGVRVTPSEPVRPPHQVPHQLMKSSTSNLPLGL